MSAAAARPGELTTRPPVQMVRAVPPVQRFLLVLLVALWLPATSHCALESAAIIASHCCDSDTHEAPAHDASDDLCCGWERTLTASSATGAALLKAPAPACPFLLCYAAALFPPPPPASPAAAAAHPADWLVTWQFVYRAAPPARAPSLT